MKMKKYILCIVEFFFVLVVSINLGVGGAFIVGFCAFNNRYNEYQFEPLLYSLVSGALVGGVLLTFTYYRYLNRNVTRRFAVYVIGIPLVLGVLFGFLLRIFDGGWIACFATPVFVLLGAIKCSNQAKDVRS